MIGRNKKGGFNTSPTAVYPPRMCRFLATRIFSHWQGHLRTHPPYGDGRTPKSRVRPAGRADEGVAEEKEEVRKVEVKERSTVFEELWGPRGGAGPVKIDIREDVEQATREVEEKGHMLPVKDELDVGS